MKKIIQFTMILMLLFLTACSHETGKIQQTNAVANVLEAQATDPALETTTPEAYLDPGEGTTTETEGLADLSGDTLDLTTMGKDMVYATVYDFLANPDQYVGKSIRMSGTYYSSYYDSTQTRYYYVLIKDALACCAQGLEFIWEDGSHSYPEEYPAEESQVVVTGTFQTYEEDGTLYCHLVDATMEIQP